MSIDSIVENYGQVSRMRSRKKKKIVISQYKLINYLRQAFSSQIDFFLDVKLVFS